ncbi:hypothetical protein ACT3RM_18180, partial [Pseudoalteromonas sp. AOP7-A1-14]|uniref:hypothetical protein n=1 Tax=Pseudoalteromonas sp. AOP7-A1-14 TaxID=3457648 RepID=UPI00402BBD22
GVRIKILRVIGFYLVIPILFSFAVTCYVLFNGFHNQASFFGLMVYGLIFYGAPFFILALLFVLTKARNLVVHFGFSGATLSLTTIALMWLLPSDSSGLPIQWTAYWPLSLILIICLTGVGVALTKTKKS